MWKTLALLLLFSVPASSQELAPEPLHRTAAFSAADEAGRPAATLRATAVSEGRRLGVALASTPFGQSRDEVRMPERSWISRHPVLFGLMVGAAAGAATSALMENELFCSGGDEDCVFHDAARVPTGMAMGAGIGAAVGALVGLGRP